ncbi:hypothetical protein [Acidithiobacillus thiooxidans]|uniref:hypothetical protein n=1 Tax=Acidithiobacillus thiooxidans TaxID=930 RepID=UPI0009DA645E|nr:hypothetical protein [Acidithiobacillus thiooxidans]
MNQKLLDMLGKKGLGKSDTSRKEPIVSASDPLIDEALSDTPVNLPTDHETPNNDDYKMEPEQQTANLEQPSTPEPHIDDPLVEGNHGLDDADVEISAPESYSGHSSLMTKKKKIVIFSTAVGVLLAISVFGYEEMKTENIASAQLYKIRSEQPKTLSGELGSTQTTKAVRSTNPAAAAAASLNPDIIQKQMKTEKITTPIINTETDQTHSSVPPDSPSSPSAPASTPSGGESAYVRWADSQIHQGAAPKEPIIPSSALSDTPPSGPGLNTGYTPSTNAANNYTPPAYSPQPEYHRPSFGLAIPGAQQGPSSKHILPLRNSDRITASVTQKTPPPYEVLRTVDRSGEEYAYVVRNGDISTGKWVSYGHRFASGWILGKISVASHSVSFSAPQGYSVSVGVR